MTFSQSPLLEGQQVRKTWGTPQKEAEEAHSRWKEQSYKVRKKNISKEWCSKYILQNTRSLLSPLYLPHVPWQSSFSPVSRVPMSWVKGGPGSLIWVGKILLMGPASQGTQHPGEMLCSSKPVQTFLATNSLIHTQKVFSGEDHLLREAMRVTCRPDMECKKSKIPKMLLIHTTNFPTESDSSWAPCLTRPA